MKRFFFFFFSGITSSRLSTGFLPSLGFSRHRLGGDESIFGSPIIYKGFRKERNGKFQLFQV